MGRSRKFDYQAAIKICLIAHPDGLTLDELLERSGLEVDRSTLFRHLTQLIQGGGAERIGNARASRYRSLLVAKIGENPAPPGTALAPVQRLRPAENYPSPAADAAKVPESNSVPEPTDVPVPDHVPALAPEHEAVVKKAVCTAVRSWKRCSRVNLQIYLSLLAKPEYLDALAAAVEQKLAGLHAGNLAEFGLTQAEFSLFTPLVETDKYGEK